MDALCAIQVSLYTKLNNAFANFKKKGRAQMDKSGALTRLESLETSYEAFSTHHYKILSIKDVDLEHEYFTNSLADKAEEAYLDRKAEFRSFLQAIEDEERASAIPQSNQGDQGMLNASMRQYNSSAFPQALPKIQVPTFSGKLSDWNQFRDLFKSMIHRSEDLDPIVKLYYLRTHVQGEALDRIRNLEVVAENYTVAWSNLHDHYENKRRQVNQTVASLFALKAMKSESHAELRKLYAGTFDTLSFLESLGRPVTSDGTDLFVFLTVSRFDATTRKDWEKLLGNTQEPPTIEQLKTFLQNQMATLESIENGLKTSPVVNNSGNKITGSTKSHAASTQPHEQQPTVPCCPLDKESHTLFQCKTFRAKSVNDRKNFVIEKRLCFQCLGSHAAKYCKSKKRCQTCRGKHNSLLHIDTHSDNASTQVKRLENGSDSTDKTTISSNACTTPVQCLVNTPSSGFVLLATAIVKVTGSDGSSYFVRGLIDQCSQSSFISASLSQRLGLVKSKACVSVTGVGGLSPTTSKSVVEVSIMPRFNSTFSCVVTALVLPKISGYKPPQAPTRNDWTHLIGLTLADPHYLDDRPIDMLLGADVHALIVQGEIIKGEPHQPIATNTKLGWIISGPTGRDQSQTSTFIHCVDNSQLNELLQSFWRQEELPTSGKLLTPDEQYCENHFLQNYSQNPEGRYVVRLPFIQGALEDLKVNLNDSYDIALKTLFSMERKFEKNPEFKHKYSTFMEEYESLKHMHVSQSSFKTAIDNGYFLPHHGVIQGSKKLRTVFNGSSKVHGISLNDLLHSGPNLIPELFDLIARWRRYEFVFVADIEKMYRQILVDSKDKKYQLILWRKNSLQEVLIYVLDTITYGLKCSPFLAIRTLVQLAKDYGHLFVQAAPIILSESYVDDFMSGGHSIEEAHDKQVQLIGLLKVGGFELRKWAANAPELEDWLPAAHRIRDSSIFDSHCSTSILGLSWRPDEDNFLFKIVPQEFEISKLTKRIVLSLTARIFDPMGWLAPVVITSKIFMQTLWLLKCDWDDSLPEQYAENWAKWYRKLPCLESIRIPRWSGYVPADTKYELHGFADASSKAYGAVLYLRLLRQNEVIVSLQCSKTRVAPTQSISIPRLELCAAHLLAKLANRFIGLVPLETVVVHLWSDSRDVLYWIREHPSRWQTFVANRCSHIQTLVPTAFWHHVRSKSNPADIISRGIEPDLLESCSPWWNGPEFLHEHCLPWDTEAESILIQPLEEKTSSHVVSSDSGTLDQASDWSIVERFSTLNKLLRVTAYCLRFINNIGKKLSNKLRDKIRLFKLDFLQSDFACGKFLCHRELVNSELLWIFLYQQASFAKEIKYLESNQVLKNASLMKLHPFLDKGLLRVGGRLQHSALDYKEKHPLILPSRGHLAVLLIRDAHIKSLHGGTQLTLSTLRIRYWILKGRQLVRNSINKCTTCLRYSAKMQTQLMGSLPKVRVEPAFPFERSGVDYAGPFKLRLTKSRGKGTTKGYVAVFICLSTRAVHLEAVEDCSTEAFIAAFKRFTSRRGHCSLLMSDRGTNFVGASTELRRFYDEASAESQQLASTLANTGTQWQFNPPAAPHFGGIWEAAVKSAKHHLRRIVGEHVLTFVEMSTLLCQVESCLNSRPLSPLTDSSSDFEVLTPSHFLIQRPSFILPEPSLLTRICPIGERWQRVTQMSQQFWSSWSRDYLKSLQERGKWSRSTRPISVGDVTLLRDNLTPPSKWPLALVTNVFPGKDGQVRVAEVKTATTTFTRPVVKLILLIPAQHLEHPEDS